MSRLTVAMPSGVCDRPGGFSLGDAVAGETVTIGRTGIFSAADVTRMPGGQPFQTCFNLFVGPEMARRGLIQGSEVKVPLQRALIIFRPDGTGTVRLNEEVALKARVCTRDGHDLEAGAPVLATDIDDIVGVSVGSVRAADDFILYFPAAGAHRLVFDLQGTPPRASRAERGSARVKLLTECRDLLLEEVFGQCFRVPPEIEQAMLTDGWFRALCLLPLPYLEMVTAYAAGSPDAAASAAQSYFTTERIEHISQGWFGSPEFAEHKTAIEEGIASYCEGRHTAAVRTLLPCLEGIMRTRCRLSGDTVPRHLTNELAEVIAATGATVTDRAGLPRLEAISKPHVSRFAGPRHWGQGM